MPSHHNPPTSFLNPSNPPSIFIISFPPSNDFVSVVCCRIDSSARECFQLCVVAIGLILQPGAARRACAVFYQWVAAFLVEGMDCVYGRVDARASCSCWVLAVQRQESGGRRRGVLLMKTALRCVLEMMDGQAFGHES